MWNISPVLYLLGIKFAWTCDRFRGFSDTSTHVSHCSAVIGTLQVQKSGFASLSSLNAWLCGSVVAQLCPRLKPELSRAEANSVAACAWLERVSEAPVPCTRSWHLPL
jgi:hypothetical protein